MLLTCHEEIGHVGRVDEDDTRVLRGKCSRGILAHPNERRQQTNTHTRLKLHYFDLLLICCRFVVQFIIQLAVQLVTDRVSRQDRATSSVHIQISVC